MGQCMVRASIPTAICVACVLVLVALSRPQPLADRLAVIPESETRIDNVKPFDAREKWAANGSQAGLHRLNPTRVAYFDKRIRSLMRPPFRVLDAGCGGGLVSNALAGLPGYSVQGVDMSPEALRFAQETAERVNLTSVAFSGASLYSIPFANESFDVVIMSDVLEHLLDLRRGLVEVARVLRPGGVLLFDTIDRTWSSYLVAIIGAERIIGIVQKNSHDWRLFIRPKELKKGLEQSGFHSFAYESFDPTPRSLLELSLFQFGLLPLEWMRGGWHIGSASMVMVSYIGQAVKSGKPKAAARSAPSEAPPQAAAPEQAAARSAPSEAPPQAAAPEQAAEVGAHRRELRQVDGQDASNSSARSGEVNSTEPPKNSTEPLKHQFKVGEDIELRVADGPSKGSWVRGRVRSLGSKSDTYWLHVPALPPAERDIPWTIPASSLRRLEVATVEYKVGERMEIMAESGPLNGRWLPARVVELGVMADTYDVIIESGNSSGRIKVKSVPAKKMRKSQARPPAVVFEAGDFAEIRGAGGQWTQCNVTARGERPDTYDVRVGVMKPPGFQAIRNVPAGVLRKRKASPPARSGAPDRGESAQRTRREALGELTNRTSGNKSAEPQEALGKPANKTSGNRSGGTHEAWAEAKGDFKAGQRCLLLSTSGSQKGSWTSCTVLGKGRRPDTYDVRVPGPGENSSDIHDVPVEYLVGAEAVKAFKVGQMARVKIFKGKAMGTWVECVITGRGPHPNRYDINVLSTASPGYSEVRNVSAFALRQEEEPSATMPAWAAKALAEAEEKMAKAAAPPEQYKVGEVALVKVSGGGPKDGSWVKCAIWGHGSKPDTYNIRVGTTQAPGHIDLTDIPASGLAKVPKVPLPKFEAGAQAEIQVHHGPLAGVWMRCLVLGPGLLPDTYNIRMMGVPFQEDVVFSGIPVRVLRELPKDAPVLPPPPPAQPPPEQIARPPVHPEPAEPEVALPVFQEGDTAEVRASEGWVRCIIGERGRARNSYNIRVVSDNMEGYLDVPNVPAHKLRKSARPSTLSMIMWIVEILFSGSLR